jgi:hypothetical protein
LISTCQFKSLEMAQKEKFHQTNIDSQLRSTDSTENSGDVIMDYCYKFITILAMTFKGTQ